MRLKDFEAIEEIRNSYLVSFCIYRNLSTDIESLPNISIVLINRSNLNHEKTNETKLVFEGVVDLKVGKVADLFIPQIEIQNISSYQIEGARFKVSEVEHSMFTFLCNDFHLM